MSLATRIQTAARAWLCWLTLLSAAAGQSPDPSVAYFNDFDDPAPSWELDSPTSVGQIVRRERLVNPPADDGASVERLVVVGPPGESVRLAHAINAAPVIDESRIVVRVRTNRPGIQVAARIVLPRSTDGGNPPQTLVVRGTSDDTSGEWCDLEIRDLPKLVTREARLLRTSSESPIDERGAYLDQVILIVPGGRESTEVAIDRLTVEGIVASPNAAAPATAMAGPQFPSTSLAASAVPAPVRPVRVSGNQITVNDRPFFPRIVQHNGEDFEFLARCGFNGIWLREAPTSDQLEAAVKLGVGLISPPPREPIPVEEAAEWNSILAWDLGERLAATQLDVVTAQAQTLRREDRHLQRPLVAAPSDSLARFSRVADILLIGKRPSLHDVYLHDWQRDLQAAHRTARPGTPAWARIDLDHSAELAGQIRVLAPHTSGGWQAPQRIASQTQAAVGNGANGLVFASRQTQSAANSTNQLTLATCELLNRELRLIEPWLVGGTTASLATCSDPGLQAVVMQRDRVRLVAIRRLPMAAPIDEAQQAASPHAITVPGVPESAGAYLLSPGGMRIVEQNRVSGGVRVPLKDVPAGTYLVLSDDRAAIAAMMRSASQGASRAVQLARFLSMDEVQQAEQTAAQLQQLPAAQKIAQQTIAVAKTAIGQANLALASGNHEGAYRHLLIARDAVATLQSHLLTQPASAPGIVSSPLAGSFPRLLDQWKLDWALAALPMGENLLPGGDCEELAQMQSYGWTHTRYPVERVHSAVELTADAPQQGTRALRLLASQTSGSSSSHSSESATVWIASPEVSLAPGQTIEIAGWARVPPRFDCHLTITDSLGGEELALDISRTPEWQPFRMIRTASEASSVQVQFALYGCGEARIDGVMIRPVLAARTQPQSARRLSAVPVRTAP
ncbi:MAG: hypothetical protein WD851_02625 [Pirellulales bacterium]